VHLLKQPELLGRNRRELIRRTGRANLNVGAQTDHSAGGDKPATTVAAAAREHSPSGDIAAEHRARHPGDGRAGVLHHPSERETDRDRGPFDLTHLRDTDPRDGVGHAPWNEISRGQLRVLVCHRESTPRRSASEPSQGAVSHRMPGPVTELSRPLRVKRDAKPVGDAT
jgi:hypothetical protein